MKTLKESILNSANHSGEGFKAQRRNEMTKQVIDNVLNAHSEFPMLWFLEGNNLRLDNDTIKKIVNKLKKTLPKEAIFGMTGYGVPQIAKQKVEKYDTVNYPSRKYSYYKIEISYGTKPWGPYRGVAQTEKSEFLIYLTYDYIYALDIPETKSILDELDTHFAKYVTQDEVKLTDTYKMKSNIGGKYRIYSFKDLTEEFVDRK